MNIYCNGERTTMRIWGKRWTCDLCGKRLWRADVAKSIPTADEVAEVQVYPGSYGFRYTCRDHDKRVIYDSPSFFRNRRAAKEEAKRRWPEARVSFEV